jgi:cation diffusion facilitator CzcD-associated flavoprotein CzcO
MYFRCACDVPAHSYTFSWEGNPGWSRAYVGALELYDYFKGRAHAYGVEEFVKLRSQVTEAVWNERDGRWKLQIEDLTSGTTFSDEADVLINATGFLK